MMTCNTPYLTDVPGVATERAGYATECPEEARRDLRRCVTSGQRGIAWRYYEPPTYAQVADRIRQERSAR